MKLKTDLWVPPYSMIENFRAGMDREGVLDWNMPPGSKRVNLGAGRKGIDGAVPLDADMGWMAGEEMPFENECVDVVYAYHFLEHLRKDELLAVLREVERILVVGGVFNIVVPHYTAEIAFQDLDHKSFWTESTWRTLLENEYYDGTMPRNWKLRENQSMIMGLNVRNLVLVSQLERTSGPVTYL